MTKFRSLALASASLLSFGIFAGNAFAQANAGAAADPKETTADADKTDNAKNDIVVTGTFIRGIAPTGNQVLGVTAEDIKATGGQSTNDVLATIPQLSNMFNNLNVVGQGGGSPSTINQNAAAQVQRPNLRDLGGIAGVTAGSSPTLILMDGHRLVGAGVGQSSPDAGVIPPGLLERVEIITDGGSAIYGTDAVGGVINFITRRRFDGVRISGRYGAGNSVSNYNGDITVGKTWDSGSVFGAISYSKDNPVYGIDRDWFSAINWNPTAPFGRYLTGELRNCTPPNVTAGGINYAVTSPTTIGAANSYNACDVSDYQTITANQKSTSYFAGLTQEIVSGVELNIRGFYTHRNTLTGRGPLTASVRTDDEVFTATTGASPYYVDLPGAGANGAAQNVLFNFAPFDGNYAASNETDLKTWGITGGLKIDLGSDWKFNAIANYGESDTFYRNQDVNTARLQYYATGNGAPGATVCTFNAIASAAGCNINPYNIGASNPAVLADITNWQNYGSAHQALTNFRGVFDGSVFSLPGGEVRAAVGAEYIGQSIGHGAAVTVSLPFLDIMLNDSGTALAATGQPLPSRFGTWFWGLGVDPGIFKPKTASLAELPPQIMALDKVKQYINVFTNFDVLTDGAPNLCHFTGWVALRTGSPPAGRGDLPGASLDAAITDAIGGGTRFKSLQMAATGGPRDSYSFLSGSAVNPPETSAVELYRKIFGPEFKDPNSPTFTPDPRIMTRKSVLSAVVDQRQELERSLGAADKTRLDQYYTSIREIEDRLSLQLQKPSAAPDCKIPTEPKEIPVGLDVEIVKARHRAMTDLLAMAMVCNQTKVFNMVYSDGASSLIRKGLDKTHHAFTHEEPINVAKGYQINSSAFVNDAMTEWGYFVEKLAETKEGDGSLLDRSLVYAHSDCEIAKVHSLTSIPMFTAGLLNGKVKAGQHVDGKAQPATRLGYTVQRLMGVPVGSWGTKSMTAKQEIGEIVA